MEDEYDILEEYDELEKKYGLPSFEILAEDFDIEKISEKESSFLLREIRKSIVEKTYSYLHLFENFLSPNSGSMFVYALIKNITPEIKVDVQRIYKELSKFQMTAIKLDLLYSEEKEAGFIKSSCAAWQKSKKEIYDIFKVLEKDSGNENTVKSRDYFG